MNRKLYVGNIAYETTESDLEQLFSQSGTVESVRVMRDMATGRARGFAFVEMASEADAQTADSQAEATEPDTPENQPEADAPASDSAEQEEQ